MMVFSQPLSYALNNRVSKQVIPNNFRTIVGYSNQTTQNNESNGLVEHQSQNNSKIQVIENKSVEVLKDVNTILAFEKQGIIGKSENLPIDELTDNIFSFELKEDFKQNKDAYLEYEIFGLEDASQTTKSVNDQLATGGSIIKINKAWSKVREKLNPESIQKGKNFVKFTTLENANYQYMVRNLKMVYEDKTINEPIVFNQSSTNSYNGKIAFSGFVPDKTVTKVSVLGTEYPVINGVFEVLVQEKEPNAFLTVSYLDNKGNRKENNIKIKQLIEQPDVVNSNKTNFTQTNKSFEKNVKNTLTLAGAKLEVEDLSLANNTTFSIAGLRYTDVPTLSPEMVNVTADFHGYRMLPHGEHFTAKPAKIHLKYDEKKLPTGYTAKDIKTFYFDNEQRKWLALDKDTLLSTTQEIVSKTSHFTDFINGIIKVPESPETGSYTPTSIKDIKAADPTVGVVSIAPPSPNNMGTMNTSFPIKLPAGRSGMEPELSVSYSSEAGNGWMGLGWDLSIPGVSLDTRWGAPRYDASKETEIYSMGGGMLTLKDGADYTNPHRKSDISRQYQDLDNDGVFKERQFYPRIEGSYAKVIRHGDSPSNYWWEVTDKTGNKSFYGGYAGAVVNNSVVKTNAGNIAYWGLYRTEDTNGNYVEYIYENQSVSLPGQPGDNGNEFFIKEIKYTLHNSAQNNYYKVSFNKSNNYNVGTPNISSQRADIQVNARNGVVQVTKDLLKEIKVSFEQSGNSQTIRTYRFDYEQHTFVKSQLVKIAEYDANGELFYSNTMEYHNKDESGNAINETNFMDSNESTMWNHNDDDIKGDLLLGSLAAGISNEFTNKGSALGSTKGWGLNGGLYVGFGIPCSGSNLFTAGVNGGYSYSESKGLISFMDVNGDGLPDKIYRKDGQIKFRPNLGLPGSTVGFGSPQDITGINQLSETTSDSKSVGFQASFGVFAGYTYNTSKSVTKTYFSDVNGDGLVDLVDNGSVKFNHTLNSSYLNLASFSPDNSQTHNPVGSGAISTIITNNVTVETKDQLRDENPQHDIVKIWTAPKAGTISITGDDVVLDPIVPSPSGVFPSSSTDQYFNDYDGVRLSIQQNITPTFNNSGIIIKEGAISPTFSGSATVNVTPVDMDYSSLTVAKGDRLYFRVQAKEEGTFDRVKWNPIITYSDTNETNVDGISYYSSAASEGFILSAKDVVTISQNGTISMDWNTSLSNIPAYTFSDDLIFAIEKGNIDATTGIFSTTNTYYADVKQSINNNLALSSFEDVSGNPIPLNVVTNNGFRFSVSSKSNVNWKDIKWEPRVILTPSAGGNNIISYPVVEYGIYNKKINEVLSKVNGLNSSSIVVRPVFIAGAFTSLPDNDYKFQLVVKNNNKKVLASQNIIVTVDSGNIPIVTFTGLNDIVVENDITSTIYAEYFTSSIEAANIGALASNPITVQIYQSTNTTPVTALSVPTGTCSTRWIAGILFNGLTSTGNTCTPYYQQIATPIRSVVRNTTYPLQINLNLISNAGAWFDWNKNGVAEAGEVYGSSGLASHTINVVVPATAVEGEINVRVRGGGAVAYNFGNFESNSNGSVRDFKINVASLHSTLKDIYCKVGNNEFGPNYRNWGHFAYHGGIVIQRGKDLNGDGLVTTEQEKRAVVLTPGGQPIIIYNYGIDLVTNAIIPIDENVLITNTSNPMGSCNGLSGQALIDCLQTNNNQTATSTRFISLTPNEEFNIWLGSSKEVSVDENHFSTSRMGVKNINTIYVELPTGGSISASNCDFPAINGISLINKGEGDSVSIGGSVGGVGGSLNTSTSFNWAELNYMDLNGDRYPDILTKDNVQFTNSIGALSETRNLGFGRVSTGETTSSGAGASGSFTVATTPGTYLAFNLPIFGGIGPIIIPITAPKVKASVGINANVGTGGNTEELLWADMNGDGLSDRINMDGGIKVSLNLGYGLDAEKIWVNGTNELSGTQTNFSGGAGYTYGDYAWGGGVSLSASRAYTQSNLADINGDGLPDLILNNDSANLSYRINTGNGFDGNTYFNSGYISFNRSTAEGLNLAFSIPITIGIPPAFCFQIIINPSFGGEQTINRTENSLDDINGDGFMDILNGGNGSTNDGFLKARLSKIGKTNLLRKVNTPTGGSWEVAYERVGNTFEFAQSKYVLSKVKVFDAFTADNNWSSDRNITSIEYGNPYYDRRDREFFGFDKVKVNQHGGFNTDVDIQAASVTLPAVYRYSVQEFHNKNYYLKGAVKKETLFDANHVAWTESKTTYGIYKPETALSETETRPSGFDNDSYSTAVDVDAIIYGSGVIHVSVDNVGFVCTHLDNSRLFVTPLVSVKTFTEGQTLGSNNKYEVTIMEGIDAHGNVTQFRDYGEQGADVYVSKMEYNQVTIDGEPYFGFATKIQVFDEDGTTLKRERRAQYNANGDLERVFTKLNATEEASVKMEYDPIYGNLSKVTHENSVDSSGSQFFTEYTYDDVLHAFPINVKDAFGYTSSSMYNYLFGIPVYTTDMNMQPMRTRIDDRGRPIEITGPHELFVEGITGGSEIGWTIRFEYQDETPVATKVSGTSIDDDNYTKIYNAAGNFQAIVPDNIDTNDPTNKLHHALTRHFDPEYRNADDSVLTTNQILTSTLIDGYGKPVQVKKMFARHLAADTAPGGNTPNDTNNKLEWLLAGKAKQDAFGRAIESYYPTTQTDNFSGLSSNVSFVPTNAYVYDNTADAIEPTIATYDVLDRSLTTKLAGETEQKSMSFAIENNQFVTTVTNELGQIQKTFTDVRDKTLLTLQESVSGNITVAFEYNNIGELLKVTDVANNETSSSYDLAGRRIEFRHPDNGITQLKYDQASNVIERKTANLLLAGQKIEYKYTYNRLDEIKYPQNPENNVHYYYGTAGNSDAANDNAVGRLWYHVDATGTQYMKYGKLGELTLNRRSVAVPGDRVYWFQTEWTFDTWNRVKTIKYPDEELVTYKYNKGGELHAMTSEKNGTPNKDIISQLGYNKFGQRAYLRYGNGTETTYEYQAERRRLDRMKVGFNSAYVVSTPGSIPPNRQFVNNKYNYDVLSNILSIQNNTVAMPTTTQIGGRSWQEYTYDDLNRVTTASGNFVGRNDNGVGFNHSKYTLAMSYDSQHNITSKLQNHETAVSTSASSVAGTWTQVEQTSYNLNYQDYNTADYNVAGYNYSQPHAPRKIVDQPNLPGCCDAATDVRVKTKTFDYDANGNQTKITQKICTAPEADILRENLWDEENHLRAIDLNPEANTVHPIAIYTYDDGGDRIVKQSATSVAVYENALQVGTAIKNDFMLYPSGMLVARPAADGTGALSYTKHYFAGTQRVSSKIGTTTNLGKFLQDWTLIENSSGGAPINLVSTSHDQLTTAETGVTKVYTKFAITPMPTFSSNTAFLPVSSFTETGTETEAYWFHPDHLGSSNYVTNFSGEVSQHMEYFAFGETFIEEHKNSHNAPYKFNGKELDEESGLYYYGARYYDPRISIWSSTDPLSGFNPIFEEEHYFDFEHNGGVSNSFNHATYSYCYQNPIILLDPNGKQVKSKYLDDTWLGDYGFGNSFANGIADGLVDASPIGVIAFVKDIITKPEVLSALKEGIMKFVDDPSGSVQKMFDKKVDAWTKVLNGGGTEQERYDVGNDIGNTLGGLLTGGGLVKLFKTLKSQGVKNTAKQAVTQMKKMCFVAGTLVVTSNGLKKIEEIEVGDKVWSFNELTGKIEIKEVVSLLQNTSEELIEFSIGNEKIVCTPEHPFYVGNVWIEARYLKVNDKLTLKNGNFVIISNVQKLYKTVIVYNFEVAENHNYYVSELGVLVHNNCDFKLKSSDFGAKIANPTLDFSKIKRMSQDTLEDTIDMFKESIKNRKAEYNYFSSRGKGTKRELSGHAKRITLEENYLRSLQKQLKPSK